MGQQNTYMYMTLVGCIRPCISCTPINVMYRAVRVKGERYTYGSHRDSASCMCEVIVTHTGELQCTGCKCVYVCVSLYAHVRTKN